MKLLMFVLGQSGCLCAEHHSGGEGEESYLTFL